MLLYRFCCGWPLDSSPLLLPLSPSVTSRKSPHECLVCRLSTSLLPCAISSSSFAGCKPVQPAEPGFANRSSGCALRLRLRSPYVLRCRSRSHLIYALARPTPPLAEEPQQRNNEFIGKLCRFALGREAFSESLSILGGAGCVALHGYPTPQIARRLSSDCSAHDREGDETSLFYLPSASIFSFFLGLPSAFRLRLSRFVLRRSFFTSSLRSISDDATSTPTLEDEYEPFRRHSTIRNG